MRKLIWSAVPVICLTINAWAYADSPRAKLTQVAGNHARNAERVQGNLVIPAEPLEPTSMLAEIQAVMDSLRHSELVLKQEFGPNQKPELTRRLGELKTASRMRILHIQLKYAQEEGRTELEQRIRASIEDLQRPAAPGGPLLNRKASPPSVVQPAAKPTGGSPR